ncbi:hypothetical protein DENSPDRAFT_868598 [Dentipellis sp. KUC8613]|nr:hypothetical protein DENSPDRAFT_868598 [Dentipellis sp. KUC8613]
MLFDVQDADWCNVSGSTTGVDLMIMQASTSNSACKYILGYRREEALKKAAETHGASLPHPGGKIIPVTCSITSKASIEQAVDRIGYFFIPIACIPLLANVKKWKPGNTMSVIDISAMPGMTRPSQYNFEYNVSRSAIKNREFGDKNGIAAGHPGRDNETVQTISGFTVLPVSYSPKAHHIIYIRSHSGPSKKSNDKGKQVWPEGRTLFLVNVPPDATDRELILLFQPTCGTIEKVVFDSDSGADVVEEEPESSSSEAEDSDSGGEVHSDSEHPRKKRKLAKGEKAPAHVPKVTSLHPQMPLRILRKTGRTAHIVFLDASSIARALALSTPSKGQKHPQPRPWPTADAPLGLAHYTALYDALRPPLDAVRQHADSYMELYDYNAAERKRKLQRESKYRKGEAIVDEDGFTLVTRGGAYGQAVGGGVGVASRNFVSGKGEEAAGGKRRRRKGEKEKEGFYAFQVHEKKRKELINLKNKWEEDKAKVEKLKASRKFKPY